MAQIPVQFLIAFETLAETVLALDLEDQLRLQALLDREIGHRTAQVSQEEALLERGAQLPLKAGLQGSVESLRSDRADVSVNHDQVIVQGFRAELRERLLQTQDRSMPRLIRVISTMRDRALNLPSSTRKS